MAWRFVGPVFSHEKLALLSPEMVKFASLAGDFPAAVKLKKGKAAAAKFFS